MSRPWTSVVNGVQLNLSESVAVVCNSLRFHCAVPPCPYASLRFPAQLYSCNAWVCYCNRLATFLPHCSLEELRSIRNWFTNWYSFSIGWAVSPLHTLRPLFCVWFPREDPAKKDPAMNVWMVCGLGKKNVHVEWSGKNKLCCCFYCSIAVGCWWGLQKIDRVTFGIMTDEQVLDLGGPVWNQPIPSYSQFTSHTFISDTSHV